MGWEEFKADGAGGVDAAVGKGGDEGEGEAGDGAGEAEGDEEEGDGEVGGERVGYEGGWGEEEGGVVGVVMRVVVGFEIGGFGDWVMVGVFLVY